MNKFLYLLCLLLVGCGTVKPKIQTTKKTIPTKAVVKKKVVHPEDRIIIDESKRTEEFVATSKVKVTTEIVNAYIFRFREIAKNNMKSHGIPASITLAQGILESGAGTGRLANVANNHFGIKCHKEWNGDSVRHDDDAAQECFRKYEDPSQSYEDHSLFLTSRPWYGPLFKLEKNDYKGWAYGLKKSGYATDPKYPEKLIGIIQRYQLHQYDAEVLGFSAENPTVASPTTNEITTINTPEAVVESPENVHIVAQGETLYSISKKYNTTVDFLKTKNNLIDNAIAVGQALIIK